MMHATPDDIPPTAGQIKAKKSCHQASCSQWPVSAGIVTLAIAVNKARSLHRVGLLPESSLKEIQKLRVKELLT